MKADSEPTTRAVTTIGDRNQWLNSAARMQRFERLPRRAQTLQPFNRLTSDYRWIQIWIQPVLPSASVDKLQLKGGNLQHKRSILFPPSLNTDKSCLCFGRKLSAQQQEIQLKIITGCLRSAEFPLSRSPYIYGNLIASFVPTYPSPVRQDHTDVPCHIQFTTLAVQFPRCAYDVASFWHAHMSDRAACALIVTMTSAT